MKLILNLIFLSSICFGITSNLGEKCVDLEQFSKEQKETIAYAYKYGSKYGLGYTMAAIAWKESCAGEYRVNFSDPSAGIYHAHIPGVIKRYSKSKDTNFTRNIVGELLIRDIKFASKVALEELQYWAKVRKGNWKEIIKSYNKGFSWQKDTKRNQMAEEYYLDIRTRVAKLKLYFLATNKKTKKDGPIIKDPPPQEPKPQEGKVFLMKEK